MILYALVLFCFSSSQFFLANGFSCEREIFGVSSKFKCPTINDPSDYIYCCGSSYERRCCQSPFEDFSDGVPTVIGVVIAISIGTLLCCLIACCCCPCCLLYKRRTRGVVHNPAPASVTMASTVYYPTPQTTHTITTIPTQQPYVPLQTGVPYQTQPYLSQPAQQYSTQPYPTQPAQPYPTQPAQPYPTQPAQPYPMQPSQPYPTESGVQTQEAPYPVTGQPGFNLPENPPPYNEKQMAYNPNY